MKRFVSLIFIVTMAPTYCMEEGMEVVPLDPSQAIYDNLRTTFEFFAQYAKKVEKPIMSDDTFFAFDTGLKAPKFNYVLFRKDQKKFPYEHVEKYDRCLFYVPAPYKQLSAHFKNEYPWSMKRSFLSVFQMPLENLNALPNQDKINVYQIVEEGAMLEDFKMLYAHSDPHFKEDTQRYISTFSAQSFFEPACPVRLYVAYNKTNNQPVACTVLTHQQGEPYAGIYSITTHPNERKKGYAKALIQSLAQIAADENAQYVTVHTVQNNLADVLKKNGFQEMKDEPTEIFIKRGRYAKIVASALYNKVTNWFANN